MPLPAAIGLKAIQNALLGLGRAGYRMSPSGELSKPLSRGSGQPGVPRPHLRLDIDKGKKFRDLERFFLSPDEALNVIGPSLVEAVRRRFRKQATGGRRWQARKVPNIAGIIGDLRVGTFVPRKRFRGRNALVNTGHLRDSISWQKAGGSKLILFSSASYAGVHNEGGTVTIKITEAARKNLARKRPAFRKQFGWLFRKDEITFTVPERRFLEVTPADIRNIQKAITLVADGRQRKSVMEIGTGDR